MNPLGLPHRDAKDRTWRHLTITLSTEDWILFDKYQRVIRQTCIDEGLRLPRVGAFLSAIVTYFLRAHQETINAEYEEVCHIGALRVARELMAREPEVLSLLERISASSTRSPESARLPLFERSPAAGAGPQGETTGTGDVRPTAAWPGWPTLEPLDVNA